MLTSTRRRTRTNYTSRQLQSMEAVFAVNHYPDFKSRQALADAIDLTEARIQVRYGQTSGVKTIQSRRPLFHKYIQKTRTRF